MGHVPNIFLFFLIPVVLLASPAWARKPEVVVSIRPVHSLVAGVMSGIAEPRLLLQGKTTPHVYQLKPSDRQMLSEAEVIFMIDPRFETFLTGALSSLPPQIKQIALAKNKDIKLRPMRGDGVWNAHSEEAEEEEGHHHLQGGTDFHLWLDPQNAIYMTQAIAATLSRRYPEYKKEFQANAQAMEKELGVLDRQLAVAFAPVKDTPYFVFHDGLQYLEKRYSLSGAGAIVANLEAPLSAARLQEVRNRMARQRAVCVFSEPQFSSRVVKTASEGIPATRVEIDVLGVSQQEGRDLYKRMMQRLAGVMSSCLASQKPSGETAPSDRPPQDAPPAPHSSSPSGEGKQAP